MMTMLVMIYLGAVAILFMTYLISLSPSKLKSRIVTMQKMAMPFNRVYCKVSGSC